MQCVQIIDLNEKWRKKWAALLAPSSRNIKRLPHKRETSWACFFHSGWSHFFHVFYQTKEAIVGLAEKNLFDWDFELERRDVSDKNSINQFQRTLFDWSNAIVLLTIFNYSTPIELYLQRCVLRWHFTYFILTLKTQKNEIEAHTSNGRMKLSKTKVKKQKKCVIHANYKR